jgi:8-amino-7-oxononanoate synthase
MDDKFLDKKLDERRLVGAFRSLRLPDNKTDFCSNDYLGIATNGLIGRQPGSEPPKQPGTQPPNDIFGSGGSRLLAGNYGLIEETEKYIAGFHQAASGLIFNSGYDANLGLLSSVPQRGDIVLYDQLSHASIRDGIRLSFAAAFSFPHNDTVELERRLQTTHATKTVPMMTPTNSTGETRPDPGQTFVVTESVFSMDGDMAPLQTIATLCERYGAHLIVDEAHATGVIGSKGVGLVQELGLQDKCFARVHTFGKALGCHGAIILGSTTLRDYLINFSRSFIYTTALPPASVQAIRSAYEWIALLDGERDRLQLLIGHFRQASIAFGRLDSPTPIQVVIVPGNEDAKRLAQKLQEGGLDVRPILYPTVPKGSERLRIVLHSFNTVRELDRLIVGLR